MNDEKRKAYNADLVQRMRAGEKLSSFDAQSSWFPPRPIIQKDPEAVKRLFESNDDEETHGQ